MMDLVAGRAGGLRPLAMAVNGALGPHRRGARELNQLRRLRVERSGLLRALAEPLERGHVVGEAFRELVEVSRRLAHRDLLLAPAGSVGASFQRKAAPADGPAAAGPYGGPRPMLPAFRAFEKPVRMRGCGVPTRAH